MTVLRSKPEMKDSCIDWIGMIPKDWMTPKLLNVLRKKISDGPHETPNYVNNGIPFISIDSLNESKEINFSVCKRFITEEDYIRYSQKTVLEEGDILFSKAATIGKTAIVGNEKFMVWSPLAIIKNKPDRIQNGFLYYLMNCPELVKAISLSGSMNTQINVGMREIEQIRIPLPPIPEQQAIATHLDDRCSKIDEIIAEAAASIEGYKELKQTVIFEAVTKGLDKTALMKDSGVAWIGNIPENWTIRRFKYVASVNSNLVSPENYMNYQQIAPDCIEKDSGRLIRERTVAEAGVESWNQLFRKGQLIYSKIRPILNKVIVAPYDGLCSADMYPLVTRENTAFVQKAMLSKYFVEQVGLITQDRVKMPKINKDELANIMMAIPPRDEQMRIVEYLDKRMLEIDEIIDEKQALIDDLQAYKKALIFEIVTGKRKVV